VIIFLNVPFTFADTTDIYYKQVVLKHDSPLGGTSCGSVNVSSNNSLKFKNNKKTPLQIKLPDLFLLKHLLFQAKKNSIEPKSAVMADVD
jgi:hypothetical protein